MTYWSYRQSCQLLPSPSTRRKVWPSRVALGAISVLYTGHEVRLQRHFRNSPSTNRLPGRQLRTNGVENVLLCVTALEKHFNSRPSNVAEQRCRDELIWYDYARFLSDQNCLRLLITFKTVKTRFSSLKIYERWFYTIRSTHNLALVSTLTNTTGGATEDDWQSGIHVVIECSICVWVHEPTSLGRTQIRTFYVLIFPTATTRKKSPCS